MNTKNTITNASPLPMDNQGRWYEILSPTQVLSGDEHEQQLQEHGQEKEKKKCRGDRKAQRQRRRLRRQTIDPDTMTNLDNETLNIQQQQDDEIRKDLHDEIEICIPFDRIPLSTSTKNIHHEKSMTQPIKRKRNETTITTTKSLNTIDKRMSQLSMSQPLEKKQKMTSNQVDQNEQATVTTSKSQLSKSKTKQQQFNDKDYIPDYLKVSNRIFKQMLISSFEGATKLVKRLNTSERINFVRQYAYLIHKRFYIELQQDQWKYYYDTGINTNIWSGRVSYRWAAMNSMYHTYGRSKKLIEQRLKTIARQYQEALQQLEQHANQPLPQCMSEINPPFDFQSMLTMVIALVRKGQHKLKQQYEHNKKMLIFDSTDHRLVQTVYDYKPNTQQIRSFRNRWKAIYNKKQMEEQIEILKHRIHSNCLPPAFNLLDYSLDKIDKILTRSRSSVNNVDDDNNNQRTTLCARRLKKIGRFKYDMLELSIAAGEEKVRYWDKIAKNAKKKLIAITTRLNKNDLLSDISKQFMIAIEAREKHMIERADYITQQKMKSFFDEAPASQNDTTMDNDGVGANQNH